MQIVPIAEVLEIPASAFIPCPMHGFAQKRVKDNCLSCTFFSGVIDTDDENNKAPTFESRYRVNCAHPVGRRMTVVEV